MTAQGYAAAAGDHHPRGRAIDHDRRGRHRLRDARRLDRSDAARPDPVASFANPAGLQASSDNFVLETAASGAAQIGVAGQGGRGKIRQGMLEASNVNIVEELVDMIECQRAYEINSKMI